MPLLRPRDVDELLERAGIALQADADRASLGPHGALDRKGRPLIVYFAPKPSHPPRVIERFTAIANAARRIGAEVATPEVAHTLSDWLVFVERASGEELCLADWLALRPPLPRRRLVAERLRAAVAAVHAHRAAHGMLSSHHVLVGEGGEVVLTGLSLRALEPASDVTLAVDADGEALAALLRSLLGAEADEWTDGGFVAPPLATTGTLTVQSPKPAAAEEHTITDLYRYDSQRPVYPSDRPARPSDEPAASLSSRALSTRSARSSRPPASVRRRSLPPVRPAVWGFALLALASLVALVVAVWLRASPRNAPPASAPPALPSAPVTARAALEPVARPPAEPEPPPPPASDRSPTEADARDAAAPPLAAAPAAVEVRPRETVRRRAAPGKRPASPPRDLLEDELHAR
jgi:hypothetical protein